jgi:outer membrane murein-binding lipoprotein Lpp
MNGAKISLTAREVCSYFWRIKNTKTKTMKNTGILTAVLLTLFLAAGCSNKDQKAMDKESSGSSANSSIISLYSDKMQQIVKNDDGAMRGVKLDASMEEVKSAEGAKPSDENENLLSYSYDLSDSLTTVEVSYEFAEKKLKTITMKIYSYGHNDLSQENYEKLVKYFTAKYGKPYPDKTEGWDVWAGTDDKDSKYAKSFNTWLRNDNDLVSVSIYRKI